MFATRQGRGGMRQAKDIQEIRDALQIMLIAASAAHERFEDNTELQAMKCILDWVLCDGSSTTDMDALVEKYRARFRRLCSRRRLQ